MMGHPAPHARQGRHKPPPLGRVPITIEQHITAFRDWYVAGRIEIDQFEEAVGRVLRGDAVSDLVVSMLRR